MKYLRSLLIVAVVFTLTACANEPAEKDVKVEPVRILTPTGATALSMLGLYGEKDVTIDTVDGTDVLTAELSKASSDYDIIIAPINMGAMLESKGKTEYKLDSVVTWGNLYLVGTDEKALQKEGTLAAFGEKAVPQKVFMSSLDVKTIKPEVVYFNSVNDVQQQLLTKKANVGLLAEPAATATIAKAKEKGTTLNVLKDLQKEYQAKNKTATAGYPQAALFVKKGSEEKVASYIEKAGIFAKDASKDEKAILRAVEKATVEKLGVPNAQIVTKTWTRLNINYVKANTVKEDIATFLKGFTITLMDEHYTK